MKARRKLPGRTFPPIAQRFSGVASFTVTARFAIVTTCDSETVKVPRRLLPKSHEDWTAFNVADAVQLHREGK